MGPRMIAIPYITKDVYGIHPRMQYLVLYSATILACILVVIISIACSTFLSPGPIAVEEEEGSSSDRSSSGRRVRYISDGFKDYRAAAFVCVAALILLTIVLFAFASTASRRVVGLQEQTKLYYMSGVMAAAGLLTCMGFVLVSSFTEGVYHFLGASVFIVAHLVMHLMCGLCLYKVTTTTIAPPPLPPSPLPLASKEETDSKHLQPQFSKEYAEEYAGSRHILEMQLILGFVAVLLSIVFVSAMIRGEQLQAEGFASETSAPFYSVSALAEYGVFIVFAAMNIILALRIEHVAENYVPVEYLQYVPWYNHQVTWVAWVPVSSSSSLSSSLSSSSFSPSFSPLKK